MNRPRLYAQVAPNYYNGPRFRRPAPPVDHQRSSGTDEARFSHRRHGGRHRELTVAGETIALKRRGYNWRRFRPTGPQLYDKRTRQLFAEADAGKRRKIVFNLDDEPCAALRCHENNPPGRR